jgi:ArsR family transcriptional regulator
MKKDMFDDDARVLAEQISEQLPDPDTIERLSEFFKILGDPTRVRILSALADSELCVNDIAAALDMERSAISHQLRILRGARLVKARREGKMVCYSFDDSHVSAILSQATDHITHL